VNLIPYNRPTRQYAGSGRDAIAASGGAGGPWVRVTVRLNSAGRESAPRPAGSSRPVRRRDPVAELRTARVRCRCGAAAEFAVGPSAGRGARRSDGALRLTFGYRRWRGVRGRRGAPAARRGRISSVRFTPRAGGLDRGIERQVAGAAPRLLTTMARRSSSSPGVEPTRDRRAAAAAPRSSVRCCSTRPIEGRGLVGLSIRRDGPGWWRQRCASGARPSRLGRTLSSGGAGEQSFPRFPQPDSSAGGRDARGSARRNDRAALRRRRAGGARRWPWTRVPYGSSGTGRGLERHLQQIRGASARSTPA